MASHEAYPRIKHRATATKITRTPRKARVAKAAAPKRQLVRSIAEPANAGAWPAARPVSTGGGSLGDSTGGGRATPQFRESRGGGPVSVGDTSGGGRVTPTFRTVPGGGAVSRPVGRRGGRR